MHVDLTVGGMPPCLSPDHIMIIYVPFLSSPLPSSAPQLPPAQLLGPKGPRRRARRTTARGRSRRFAHPADVEAPARRHGGRGRRRPARGIEGAKLPSGAAQALPASRRVGGDIRGIAPEVVEGGYGVAHPKLIKRVWFESKMRQASRFYHTWITVPSTVLV